MRCSVLVAHPEGHERTAVEKIDSSPIPAAGLGRHIGTGPFMVEPCGAADLPAAQRADDVELRAAVVVACLLGPVAFAAESGLALQYELPSEEGKVKLEVPGDDSRVVLRALEHHAPVVEPHTGAVRLGLRKGKAGTRRALLVDQTTALRVGERSVGKNNLPGIEAAGVIALLFGPGSEKRDLKTIRLV